MEAEIRVTIDGDGFKAAEIIEAALDDLMTNLEAAEGVEVGSIGFITNLPDPTK